MDGEDFELLLAVEPAQAEALLKSWTLETALTPIGRIVAAAQGITLLDSDGCQRPLPDIGYEHHV